MSANRPPPDHPGSCVGRIGRGPGVTYKHPLLDYIGGGGRAVGLMG